MKQDWRTSFHGGHSGQFCAHATGSLRETVEAAIARGFVIYGLSEHAPRYDDRHIFKEEVAGGFTVEKLLETFEAYAAEAERLKTQYAGEIEILRGFETEYVTDDYLPKMAQLQKDGSFDYIVGSVHHVRGIGIDTYPESTAEAIEACGSVDAFAVEYYRAVGRMVEFLKPDIVAHLDLVKKFAELYGPMDTPKIRSQVEQTLAIVKQHGAILDLNVYPFRRGKDVPYPASWIVELAKQENISFGFGDDSHAPDTVGVGIEQGRDYLLSCGVERVAVLTRRDGHLCTEHRNL